MAQQYKVQRAEGQSVNGTKDMLTIGSTLITQGRALTTVVGYLGHANNSIDCTVTPMIGIAMEGKLASDTTTNPVLVDKLRKGDLLRWTVDTGTTTQAMVGTFCDIATGGGLDVGTNAHHDVLIVNTTCYAPVRLCDGTTEILVAINNCL